MADRQIIASAELVDANVVATLEKFAAEYQKLSADLQAHTAILEAVSVAYGENSAAAIKLQGTIDSLTIKQQALSQIYEAGAPILEANAAATNQLAIANERLAAGADVATAAENANNLATAENAVVKEASNWANVMPRAQAGTNGLNMSLASINPELVAMAAGIGAVTMAMVEASKAAIQYEAELTQIQNDTLMSDAATKQMGDTVMQAAGQSGEGLKKLAEGYRDAQDFQFSAAESAKILAASWMEARSTGADTEKVASLLSTTLHTYGLSGNEALNVTNALIIGSARAHSTFDEFSGSIQKALSIAAQLGVPMEDVIAAEAALTRNGYNMAQAQTQVVNIMTRIVNPTAQARAEIEKLAQVTPELTHAFSGAGIQEYGLANINQMVYDTYVKLGYSQGQATEATLKLMNAQRGGLGEAALLGGAYKDYNNILGEVSQGLQGKLNPAQENWNRTADTTQGKMDMIGSKFEVFKTRAGELAMTLDNTKGKLDLWNNALGALNGLFEGKLIWGMETLATATGDAGASIGHARGELDLWTAALTGVQAPIDAVTQSTKHLGGDAEQTLLDVNQFLDDNAKTFEQWHDRAVGSQQAQEEAAQKWRDTLQTELDIVDRAIEHNDEVLQNATDDKKQAYEDEKNKLVAVRGVIVQQFQDIDTAQQTLAKNAQIAARNFEQAWAAAANSQPGFAPGAPNYMGGAQGNSPYVLPTPITDPTYYPYEFSPNGSGTPGTSSSHTVPIDPTGRKGRAAANKADQASDASRQAENEMNLVRAKQAVDAVQDKINATTDQYNKLIQQENDLIDALKDKETAALAPIQASLLQATQYQQAEAKKADDAIHGLDVQLHNLNETLKSVRKQGDEALKPFHDDVIRAQADLQRLNDTIQIADSMFEQTAHNLQNQLYELDLAEKAALKPYDDQIRATSDALWEENHALQAMRDAADDLAYQYYQRLLPLQNELNRMKREDQALDRANALHDEAVKTENLAAQLANLTPGTAEYLRIQKELSDQQTHQNRLARENTLEDRIALINEEKNIAMQAAEAQMHAVQMQIRADSERQQMLERERELTARTFEEQKTLLEAAAAANDHARQNYDYLMAQRQKDLQNAATLALAKENIEKQLYGAVDTAIQSQIDKLTDLRNTKQWEFQESDRINKGIVDGYKATYDQMKGYYEAEIKIHQDNVKELGKQEKAILDPLKDALKQAQETYQDLSNAYQIIEKIDSASDKGAKNIPGAADALQKAHDAIDKIVPKLPPLTSGINDMNTKLTSTTGLVQQGIKDMFDPTKADSAAGMWVAAFDKDDRLSGKSLLGTWDEGFDKMYQHVDQAWGPQTKDKMTVWLGGMTSALRSAVDTMVDYWNSHMDAMHVPSWYTGGGGGSGTGTGQTVSGGGTFGRGGNAPYVGGASAQSVHTGDVNVHIHAQTLPTDLGSWRKVARTAGIALQEEMNRHGSGAPFGR